MIRTTGLTKRYGSVRAVDGVDLDVRAGDIYGFVGANGSGKTTTVRMLLGLVLATSGQMQVLDEEMPRRRRSVLPRVGALIENPAAYPNLSGRRNLTLLDAAGPGGSRRTRTARVSEALEQVGLAGVGRRPVKQYSLGMRQRLGLAAALMRTPELLILDEPTNGLDPQGILEIRELLLDLHSRGTTVFLSSHLLAEVEQLCDRVGVLDRGRLVLQDQLSAFQQPTGRVLVRTPDPADAVTVLSDVEDATVLERDGQQLVIEHPDPALLNRLLVEGGVRVSELSPQQMSLEQSVLAVTGASADRIDGPAGPRDGSVRSEVTA
ncbi:ABC transporter ATP-binding protein [Rhodococcoides fascians]|uniref:Daunorubicin/doxorubicin resistance ATP-binding protein DrrA n=1 Tax=Rhodococcoides fascians TaxID=1828 RepID=A0A143QHL8_RHOFA|nr:ATP-binding cassette domain-containing protein [Rhodococcus fascians]AMY22258.1 Daunorubicin/doxorubicin resistance ATP-binding protein DrrA [Rhodococcus fascians]KMJ51603.1 multidrug ABC transporter ATPase [Rhodococcus fascians]OZC39221.1 multidrug ABC transporter ATP-binding protein [Rhodococcus fascians]